MPLTKLWVTDFRNYHTAELELPPAGTTVIVGDNGQGKTNLLEAIAWLATLTSFRDVPPQALIRSGAQKAVVRAQAWRDERALLLEGEISSHGRSRVQVNRQRLRRARDLLGMLQVTIFSPNDLELVKGGPALRRRYVDNLLVARHARWDAVQNQVDRVLHQRGVLLKQTGGRLDPTTTATLDVWDAKLAQAGTELARARLDLISRLCPLVNDAYTGLAGEKTPVAVQYMAPWLEPEGPGLLHALAAARPDDLRRGVTTVGPHRDDVSLTLGTLAARTHASQGEQRCVALALRLAGHALLTRENGIPPVLLLDDVFSELDEGRSRALIRQLPPGQALLTTAHAVPSGITPAATIRIAEGNATVVVTEPSRQD